MQTKEAVTEKGKLAQVQAEMPQPVQTEREKMRQMGAKERMVYIWGYYKMYFIGGLLLLITAFNIVNTLLWNPPPKTYLSVAVYGPPAVVEHIRALSQDMTEKLVSEPEAFQVAAESYHVTGAEAELQATMTQKLMANVSVGEVNLIVVDEENFETLLNKGLFTPLGEVLDGEMHAKYAEDLYRAAPTVYDEELESITLPEDDYGIRLDSNAYLASFGINTEGMLLGVVPSELRVDETMEGLRLILGE